MFVPFFEQFNAIQGTGISQWVETFLGQRETLVTDDFGNAVQFSIAAALAFLASDAEETI